VEKLWTIRAKAVEKLPGQIYFARDRWRARGAHACGRVFAIRFA